MLFELGDGGEEVSIFCSFWGCVWGPVAGDGREGYGLLDEEEEAYLTAAGKASKERKQVRKDLGTPEWGYVLLWLCTVNEDLKLGLSKKHDWRMLVGSAMGML